MSSRRRWRRLFGPEPAADVEAELDFHLEMRVRELIEQGVPPAEARRRAERRFGDYDRPRRACVDISERRRRKMTLADTLGVLRQDVAYALRLLRRAPTFATIAVLTLALGIGATVAIYSVVRAVVLQPLPYADADRLYRVRTLYPDGTPYSVSAPDFMSLRRDSAALDRVEAYTTGAVTLTGGGDPIEVPGAQVSDGLFDLLGFRYALGRGFAREEQAPGRSAVILEHGFWQQQFGADPAILGRTLALSTGPAPVVGVLAPGQRLPVDADLFAPLPYDETFSAATTEGRRSEFLAVIGRAHAGRSPSQVDQDMRRVGIALQAAFPGSNDRLTFTATTLQDFIVGTARTPLLVLMGAVGFVLLVACANVANLLLARASSRQAEMAVRTALGAGRGRLSRQVLTEAVVLGLIGGALGLALAYGATRALVAIQPGDLPRLDEIRVSGGVLWFALGLSMVTSLLFGALPAAQGLWRELSQTLREAGRSEAAGRGGQRARTALVVAEMALAVVLVTGAGLLIRSFVELTRPPDGVRLGDGIAFRVSLPASRYPDANRLRLAAGDLEARLRQVPGVATVAATTALPLAGRGSMVGFAVEGGPAVPADVNQEIALINVSTGYLDAVGATLTRGRGFTDRDRVDAPPVVVINESGVRRWFAGVDAVGRFVDINGRRCEVIGIVADLPQRNRMQPTLPAVFAPLSQRPARSLRWVVRTASDGMSTLPAIRAAIRDFDPALALVTPMPLHQLADDAVAGPRFYTSLLTLFATVALALAAIGIFGVMSYAVEQRRPEIGIRLALGASARSVVQMIVGRALVMAAVGGLLGLAAALSLGRVIQGQLYAVPLVDPTTIGGVIALLAVVAGLAALLPARRAARVDPTVALRRA